jgi:outer membrane biosynthesis protein TonB
MRLGLVNFTFALFLSLMLHALVLGMVWFDQPMGKTGISVPAVHAAPIYRSLPPRADTMGESKGAGQAVNSISGDHFQEAPKARQQQAALSRDPPGAAVAPPQRDFATFPPPIPPLTAPARSPADSQVSSTTPPPAHPRWTQDIPAIPASPSDSAQSASDGDPYPLSDSDSDPFSNLEHIQVHNGRVDAKFGRKVKTVRPRFGLAAEADLNDHPLLSTVLKVTTDTTGKVTGVDVIRSSGSIPVDLAVRLAMFNWWIQPPTDRQGHPVADVMVWKITFQ